MPDAEIEATLQKITDKRIYDSKIRPGFLSMNRNIFFDRRVFTWTSLWILVCDLISMGNSVAASLQLLFATRDPPFLSYSLLFN